MLSFLGLTAVLCGVVVGMSGCDPELLPVGIRSEHGIIELLLPTCPDDDIDLAEVTRGSADDVPAPSWSGKSFKGDVQGVVTLDTDSWTSVHGSYVGLKSFSVNVMTSSVGTGTFVDHPADLEHLPAGEFDVGGTAMTVAEYRSRLADRMSCDSGSSSTS